MDRLPKYVAAATLAVGSLCGSAPHADTMLAESGLIVGTESLSFGFDAPGAGTVSVQLTDLDWPMPLSVLDLSATSATTTLESLAGPGDVSFKISSGGAYYAHLTGEAQG